MQNYGPVAGRADPGGREQQRGPTRTRRTWLAGILVGVLVGIAWAVPLLFLFDAWFLALPVWLLIMLAASGVVLLCGITSQRAIAYGVGLLLSIPITLGAMAAFIAVAWSVSGSGQG